MPDDAVAVKDMRFSDEQLKRLREDFDAHTAEQSAQLGTLSDRIDSNTETLDDLSERIERMDKRAEGVIGFYDDVQSAARVGIAVQKFIIWIAKWGVIGTGIAAALTYATQKFGP